MLSGPCVLLENRLSHKANAYLYRNPRTVICCTHARGIDRCLAELETGLATGLHAAGFFSYELGYALEPKLAGRIPIESEMPFLWFGLFGPPEEIAQAALDETFAALGPPPPIEDLHYGHDRATHSQKINEILELIRDGDIYQANLTFPISFRYLGDPLCLYAALRSRQPVSHGGLVVFGDATIHSVSPELFLQVEGNIAKTRPMKGTSRRGANPQEDLELSRGLRDDPKQRAENLMIVDLLRNDLSRIAEFGSVRVPSLFEVETYPGFHAMSSTITATVRSGIGLRQKLAALFPCGSIIGAPKIRAAEILHDLEDAPRGVYTGAIGAIAPNGNMRFNVAIRTAILHRDGAGSYGVGGGIVAESRPDAEYDEALLKAKVLTELAKPYDLIETFRWEPDRGFIRLSHHLDRLTRSAHQLGFHVDRTQIESQLGDMSNSQWRTETNALRVRMTLDRTGHVGISATILPRTKPGTLRVCVAEKRLDPADPFLRHKTSLRDTYEIAFSRAAEAGYDEAIFLNTRGEVAEASRNNVFVAHDGRLLTPPVSSGVLPGVLRRSLIESGEAIEQVLRLEDLKQAEFWYLGNSLYEIREGLLF